MDQQEEEEEDEEDALNFDAENQNVPTEVKWEYSTYQRLSVYLASGRELYRSIVDMQREMGIEKFRYI